MNDISKSLLIVENDILKSDYDFNLESSIIRKYNIIYVLKSNMKVLYNNIVDVNKDKLCLSDISKLVIDKISDEIELMCLINMDKEIKESNISIDYIKDLDKNDNEDIVNIIIIDLDS